jgi:hydrogenase-4 component B
MPMNITLTLIAIVLFAASGCPGLWSGRRAAAGQWIATLIMTIGSATGMLASCRALLSGDSETLEVPWLLPWGSFAVRLDALSACFLLPVLVIPTLGSVYGMSYWAQAEHADSGRKLRFFYGLLTASMAMVVMAHDSILFLLAWEVMAISAFVLITTEDGNNDARQAGWIYLIAAHLGTLCLLPMFLLLAQSDQSFAIDTTAVAADSAMATAIFVLAVIGFGLKAGIVPLHVWLPGAHANAPSHVSAVLSGVMLKMGVYGLVRVLSLFSAPPEWWGATLLAVGAATGIIGIVYAIGQHDLKRLLAYSSIENIGIIMIGIGLAVLGSALDQPAWIALGLGGALLHVWNHSLFKPLLFFAAGSVIHSAHTREMDRLGGLGRTMRQTAALFCIGAIAICGLPPLNGFVSELSIYLGLFATLGVSGESPWPWASFAAPALAMIGGLAVVCFVKSFGAVFLGTPRTARAAQAHEASRSMRGAMFVLAGGCLVIGLVPGVVLAPIQQAITVWSGSRGEVSPIASLVPTTWMSVMGFSFVLVAVAIAAIFRTTIRGRASGTWDCGYAAPPGAPRIQYSGSSLAQMLVELYRWALWPRRHLPHIMGRFPQTTRFKSYVPDAVLDRALLPSFHLASMVLPWMRLLQQGRVQIYVLYILAILLVLLVWG